MGIRNKIDPTMVLTICTSNPFTIVMTVTDRFGKILALDEISSKGKEVVVCRLLLGRAEKLVQDYNVDLIIMEECKLLVDRIDRFPDSYILRSVTLAYGVAMFIEYRFWEQCKILLFPDYLWKKEVLGNKSAKYSIDLYKSHILHRADIPKKTLIDIENGNYYECLCLSECSMSGTLCSRKYQINKEIKRVEKE